MQWGPPGFALKGQIKPCLKGHVKSREAVLKDDADGTEVSLVGIDMCWAPWGGEGQEGEGTGLQRAGLFPCPRPLAQLGHPRCAALA